MPLSQDPVTSRSAELETVAAGDARSAAAKDAAGSPALLDPTLSDEGEDGAYEGPDRTNPKVRQLLDAAHRLFLAQPYDVVSTDAIAREAKVSKATLYVYFPSKEALFSALIGDQCSHTAHEIWRSSADCADVEAVLRKIAHNFVAMFAVGDKLGLYRIVVAQVPRFPELGRMFFESGPMILQERIAAFLARATERGLLDVPDARLAAVQFLQLIAGDLPLTGMLCRGTKSPEEVDAVVDGGIALFMAGYGPKGLYRERLGTGPAGRPHGDAA